MIRTDSILRQSNTLHVDLGERVSFEAVARGIASFASMSPSPIAATPGAIEAGTAFPERDALAAAASCGTPLAQFCQRTRTWRLP